VNISTCPDHQRHIVPSYGHNVRCGITANHALEDDRVPKKKDCELMAGSSKILAFLVMSSSRPCP